MKYKQYSPEIWQRIDRAIESVHGRDPAPVAAFDADGTLWDIDLGESFFHHQIDHSLVEMPADPWNYYVHLKQKNGDPREAYLWLAQIQKGQRLEKVRDWAYDCVKNLMPLPIFPDQRELITKLHEKGVEVFVVTASITWAVEPGAAQLGIPPERVIGVETQVENGLVTEKGKGVITYRQGKTEALLAATGGRIPFLCAGNTMGDLQLLESSSDIKLAVSAAARDDRLFKAENELHQAALKRGWLSHRFVGE